MWRGVGAFDLDLMAETVERLMKGQMNVETLSPDFTGKKRQNSIVVEEAPDVIIAEGCYLLTHKKLVDLATVKIFVDCDPDVRLARKGIFLLFPTFLVVFMWVSCPSYPRPRRTLPRPRFHSRPICAPLQTRLRANYPPD